MHPHGSHNNNHYSNNTNSVIDKSINANNTNESTYGFFMVGSNNNCDPSAFQSLISNQISTVASLQTNRLETQPKVKDIEMQIAMEMSLKQLQQDQMAATNTKLPPHQLSKSHQERKEQSPKPIESTISTARVCPERQSISLEITTWDTWKITGSENGQESKEEEEKSMELISTKKGDHYNTDSIEMPSTPKSKASDTVSYNDASQTLFDRYNNNNNNYVNMTSEIHQTYDILSNDTLNVDDEDATSESYSNGRSTTELLVMETWDIVGKPSSETQDRAQMSNSVSFRSLRSAARANRISHEKDKRGVACVDKEGIAPVEKARYNVLNPTLPQSNDSDNEQEYF